MTAQPNHLNAAKSSAANRYVTQLSMEANNLIYCHGTAPKPVIDILDLVRLKDVIRRLEQYVREAEDGQEA